MTTATGLETGKHVWKPTSRQPTAARRGGGRMMRKNHPTGIQKILHHPHQHLERLQPHKEIKVRTLRRRRARTCQEVDWNLHREQRGMKGNQQTLQVQAQRW
jgi:hypothetical protein